MFVSKVQILPLFQPESPVSFKAFKCSSDPSNTDSFCLKGGFEMKFWQYVELLLKDYSVAEILKVK